MNCIVVCGPTASGKTKLAVQIADLMKGEILSADSRQVYRRMDIGTGKDLHEYFKNGRSIPYHLIDIVDPQQIYTLYDYQRDFYRAFKDVSNRGCLPVIAGGSGLYIEAVLKGYRIASVPEDVEFRKSLMAEPYEKLLQMLTDENPELLAKTDISTKKRIVRALEISRFGSNEEELSESDFPQITPLILYVVWERSILRKRIEKRLRERLENGMLDEAAALLESGISIERLELFGMEYKHAVRYLTKKVSYELMVSELLQDIFHLAKRQDTWFRGMERRGMEVRRVQTADFEEAKKYFTGS
ncbi:MAG: tRNA (adenosine(37)-N6)-dimethylallyltransferase MiaA [Chitinispirillales bacterium]|jgi:tRNA dimethylallyltransferase|nr:tRNA (adenosine(37)-N6)-dimethylallyltransferase MiaA [Chitinispirillales bacterium]